MRRSLAALVAVVGLVDEASGAVVSASTPVAPDGVTKDEIKIGITYPDLEAIRSVTNTNHGDYEAAYNAVIDDLNKQGGINGRKVVPVFAAIDPLGTAPAQEACIKLTEDEKVFAAMSFFNADAPLCFVPSHDTPILGGQTTRDEPAAGQGAVGHAGVRRGTRPAPDRRAGVGRRAEGQARHRRHRRRGAEPAEGRRAPGA